MTGMDILSLLLTSLAVARVTRLIVEDEILAEPRMWALMRLDENGKLAYLLVCPWCMSVWVGAGASAAWWAWGGHRWFLAVVAALAFSYVAGFLASKEGEA
jgi:hypothetical protein